MYTSTRVALSIDVVGDALRSCRTVNRERSENPAGLNVTGIIRYSFDCPKSSALSHNVSRPLWSGPLLASDPHFGYMTGSQGE